MKVGMRIALSLALFLALVGTVYGGTTAYEWRGTVLLLVCAAAFLYIGLVLRGAVRRASVPVNEETMAPEELSVESEYIGPTIWPFVFSIAALLLVVGVVGIHWILIPGGILFIGAAAGWFRDIKGQRHADELGGSHEGSASSRASTLQGQQQPDDDHRD